MTSWTFSWKDEDPISLILLVFIAIAVLFVPWRDLDPTKELKVGPAPVVAPATTK